jgi:CheY-like chemotaxis protein
MSTDILVVDDSKFARAMIGGILRYDDRSIREAQNGREALEQVEIAIPDLVVTDLRMPEMDGLELVRALHDSHPSIPVILVTAFGSESVACEALRDGAASYVAKRSLERDLDQLASRILAVTSRHRSNKRLFSRLKRLEYTFDLKNDVSVVAPLVNHLQEMLAQMQVCCESELPRIAVALDEALVNAIVHGNLEVSSDLRDGGGDAYFAQIKERQTQDPYAERTVHVQAIIHDSKAIIRIEDEGPGFDHQSLPDPTDPENLANPAGRGVLLMRMFMDDVCYNKKGNCVTLYMRTRG